MVLSVIHRYFPELSILQQQQFEQLEPLYREWNERINVVSRKDIDALAEHHILHSLAIAKFCRFAAGATILDVGTGGGFPGIPLAIFFPDCRFTLVDSIGKKIKVVQAISDAIGLKNVTALHLRCESLKQQFDFVVSRAVTDLPTFVSWVWPLIKIGAKQAAPNGIIYLKGGDLQVELAETVKKLPKNALPPEEFMISKWFDNEFFITKKLIYLAR
ncbi:MAG: 16S rRNA (guanine(527)-N(7))-methyltransferase RsmG [Bacteroidales bacterium]|nr:16S rRNA (guanine(527)-N(7))-methyltransferase RsmG [Bacteroidales bacterium]MCL2133770.1 16S rRNA (guanine(527)-N(7))-methyltransferase RsmG [Bacteroidales bacterium]